MALKELSKRKGGMEDEVVAHFHLGDGPLVIMEAGIVPLLIGQDR